MAANKLWANITRCGIGVAVEQINTVVVGYWCREKAGVVSTNCMRRILGYGWSDWCRFGGTVLGCRDTPTRYRHVGFDFDWRGGAFSMTVRQ